MRNFICSILLLGSVTIGFGQNFQKEKLDEYLNALEKTDRFSGSVAIGKDGKILYERSIGFADRDSQKKLNTETKFRIGSISKTFTATLIMKAVQNGKLDLNQTIEKFFPTLKNASKIQLTQLLNHTSGIHSFTSENSYLEWYTEPKSRKELLDLILAYESDFEPGTQTDYSNSNYILLSMILENVYQKPYEQILEEQIIKPLGLTKTYMGGKIKLDENEAYSYSKQAVWIKLPETDMSIPLGAGAIVSTPSDLIQFGEALFNGKIISDSSLNKMTTYDPMFGLGLIQFPFHEHRFSGHDGAIDGFNSLWAYNKADKYSIALISNGSLENINNIAIAMLSSLYNLPFDIPKFETVELKSEELDPYLGTYSNPNFPLKIKISKKGNQLFAQADGQSEFPLDALGEHQFKFDMAGIRMKFVPEANKFEFSQGPTNLEFTKE